MQSKDMNSMKQLSPCNCNVKLNQENPIRGKHYTFHIHFSWDKAPVQNSYNVHLEDRRMKVLQASAFSIIM